VPNRQLWPELPPCPNVGSESDARLDSNIASDDFRSGNGRAADDASSAYDKDDFGRARNLYSELAIQGDRIAQLRADDSASESDANFAAAKLIRTL
jgi:hypothetical protein